MTFQEFLRYAAEPSGVTAIVGFVISLLADMWPAFGSQSPRDKRIMIMGFSFVVPLVAILVSGYLYGPDISVDSVWAGLAAGFTSFFVSQARHVVQLPTTQQ